VKTNKSRSHTHTSQNFRNWSHVHEKSSGAGAVSFLRRLRSLKWSTL